MNFFLFERWTTIYYSIVSHQHPHRDISASWPAGRRPPPKKRLVCLATAHDPPFHCVSVSRLHNFNGIWSPLHQPPSTTADQATQCCPIVWGHFSGVAVWERLALFVLCNRSFIEQLKSNPFSLQQFKGKTWKQWRSESGRTEESSNQQHE